jgi:hypothetical protein
LPVYSSSPGPSSMIFLSRIPSLHSNYI